MGLPGTLNLGLIPLQKTKIKKKFQKTHLCAASYLHEKYVYLFRSHQLVAEMISPNLTCFLTQVQMLSLLTKHGLKSTRCLLMPLCNPIPVYNVDGTRNSAGSITHAVELIVELQGHCEKITAEVMDLGKNTFILGFSWLKCHNPDIDWTKGMVKMTHCPQHHHMLQPKLAFLASLKREEYDIQYQVHKTICVLEVQQEKPKEKTPEE